MARNNRIGKGNDSKRVKGSSITNAMVDTKKTLQIEVKSRSQMVVQNQLALDDLLEAKGGLLALINTSGCFCVDQDKRIETGIMTIQSHLKVFFIK